MKKLIALTTVLLLLAFAPTVDPSLKVQGNLTEWNRHLSKLEGIRKIVDESNMTNQEVKFITRTIDSLEMLIVPQLQKQLADTTKR